MISALRELNDLLFQQGHISEKELNARKGVWRHKAEEQAQVFVDLGPNSE
jgi:hypothetical protein